MKNLILACALAASATAWAQPAERCDDAAPAAGAPAACPKAPPAATVGPIVVPIGPAIGKAEHPEGTDPRQTPYKAGLKQQCDAMAQMLRSDTSKLTPRQEAQVREQHRAFRC